MTVGNKNLIKGYGCYYCMFMVYTQRKNIKKKNNENKKDKKMVMGQFDTAENLTPRTI